MRSFILPVILFILLILESITINLLPSSILALDLYYIPHWLLVFSILITIYYDELHSYYGILNGVLFAFLFELIYTDLLGIYLLAYAVALYMVHLLKRFLHKNFIVTFLLVTVSLIVAEFILFALYFIVGQVDLTLTDFISLRLIPTVLINILFLLIIYPIFAKRLMIWKEKHKQLQ